ncbi:ABC transporter ATP-binding protein [Agreia bicolorata]|uniref:Sugar ABC transporter n=1 Tax=Agreia bicolorata TaxID=110935 RepID=A0ABR5CEV2_9MICO|nr:ABC transporter ATP-binding protein [Agreia bicolorata]KJC64152.1 sugar ABC transporter [Agreia bicolorata]
MSSPRTLVEVKDVSKRFIMHKDKTIKERLVNFRAADKHRDDFWALKDINLDIEAGSTVGLVGHNGSGKSTLLKVIGGIIEPTSGTVRRRGRLAALLELGAGFHQDLTGRENVYLNSAILGLTRKQTDKYFDAIVDFSGIEDFIDTQVKFYSSGMYVRLAFAVAVHVDPDLLLVDEVLAVGDEPFQRKCMDKIGEFQREGRTIVLVSHSSEQVGRLCDRVVVLDHGDMIHDGNAVDGLRVLRYGFEQARLLEEEEKKPEEISHAKIASISADSREKNERGAIVAKSDLTLSYTYELQRNQEPLVAGIAIETLTGQPVYGLNTRMLGMSIPDVVGTHTVDFVLRRQSLGAGQYLVRGSLEELAGRSLDRLNPASTFEVDVPTVGSGMVSIDAEGLVRQ